MSRDGVPGRDAVESDIEAIALASVRLRGMRFSQESIEHAVRLGAQIARSQRDLRSLRLPLIGGPEPATAVAWLERFAAPNR